MDERQAGDRAAAAGEIAPQALRLLRDWQPSGQPLSRAQLARWLGCSDRVLRAAMALLRQDGHLVIADDQGGYRLATNGAEVRRYTATLRSRIEELWAVVRAMESEAAREFSQERQMSLALDR